MYCGTGHIFGRFELGVLAPNLDLVMLPCTTSLPDACYPLWLAVLTKIMACTTVDQGYPGRIIPGKTTWEIKVKYEF
jgi:hypothetical protein